MVSQYNSLSISEYSRHNFVSRQNNGKLTGRWRRARFQAIRCTLFLDWRDKVRSLRQSKIVKQSCLNFRWTGGVEVLMLLLDLPSERPITFSAPITLFIIKHTLSFPRFSAEDDANVQLKIEYTLPVEMPLDAAMKPTNSRRSLITSLLTFSTVSSSREVACRPRWCRSSHDDRPGENSACHFANVE